MKLTSGQEKCLARLLLRQDKQMVIKMIQDEMEYRHMMSELIDDKEIKTELIIEHTMLENILLKLVME